MDRMTSPAPAQAFRLVIPLKCPSQNTRERRHWSGNRKEKSAWYFAIASVRNRDHIPKARRRRRLTIEYHSPRALDPSNVIGGAKGIIDDLTQLGLLVDDTPEWVTHGEPVHIKTSRGEAPFTVLILEEVA